jgi:hypothetical protein
VPTAGGKLHLRGEVPVQGGTTPASTPAEDMATGQRQTQIAAVGDPGPDRRGLVVNARMGEQQRPAQVTGGLLGRLRPG